MRDRAVDAIAAMIVGTMVAIVLGTIIGVWIRVFWRGWVFAG